MPGFGLKCFGICIAMSVFCVQSMRLNLRKSAVDTMPASCLGLYTDTDGYDAMRSHTPPRNISGWYGSATGSRNYYWPRCCSKCALGHHEDEGDILPVDYNCVEERYCWRLTGITRYGWKSWYVVKDGKSLLQNIQSKNISAKPEDFTWSQLGLWNYTRSKKKTKTIIKVNLKEGSWNRVKLDLALRFRFGGRCLSKEPYAKRLRNKGRFVRAVRVVPTAYVATDRGFYLNARVGNVTVGYRGPKTDPVAEVNFKVFISYGKKGSGGKRLKKEWKVSVLGNGRYSARKLQ